MEMIAELFLNISGKGIFIRYYINSLQRMESGIMESGVRGPERKS